MSKKSTSQRSTTNWAKIKKMPDAQIDLSDDAELSPEMFAKGILRRGLKPVPRKKQITLRIDEDVLDWFRNHGPGYQTQINQLLREYMRESIKAQQSGK